MTQPLDHAQEYMRLVSSQLKPTYGAIANEGPRDSLSQLIEDANILRRYEASQREAIAKLRRNRFAIVAR
jgi:hypothetical protein